MKRYWPVLLFLVIVIIPAIGTQSLERRYRVLPTEAAMPYALAEIALSLLFIITDIRGLVLLNRVTTAVFCSSGIAMNVFNLAYLIGKMLDPHGLDGQRLLISAIYVWVSNVLFFAITYWAIDGNGARARSRGRAKRDFIFPEMTLDQSNGRVFMPTFGDYFYVAFSTSTAFSATDTLTASTRIRGLLVIQAAISLATLAIVAARAVNIIPAG